MLDLESKLDEELEKSSRDDQRVVACRFPFPNWTPTEIVGSGIDTVWLYHSGNKRKS